MELPINPVVSGLLKGYALAQQLRESAMQREEFERRKMIQDRQAQIQDIQAQEMLNRASRPIEGGTVADTMHGPDVMGVPTPGMEVRRKPDAARTVRYKTASGQTIEGELYTPEEQAKKTFNSKMTQARAMNDLAFGQTQRLREGDVVDVPGVGRVPTKAIPLVTAQTNIKAADARAIATNTSRESTAAANRTSQQTIATTRAAATTGAARIRANAKGTSGTDAAAEKTRGMNERQMSALERQEGGLHTYRQILGDTITAATETDESGNLVNAEAEYVPEDWKPGKKLPQLSTNTAMRARQIEGMRRRLGETTDKVARIVVEKYDRLEKAGGTPDVSLEEALTGIGVDPAKYTSKKAAGPAPAAKTTAAPAVKTAPPKTSKYKPGDVVSKGGKKYRVLSVKPNGELEAEPI